MCGIAGAFDLAGQRYFPSAVLRSMVRSLAHRGPDDEQILIKPGVALAVRRLAIVDIANGRQPMSNENGDIWVAFEGELYDHQDLRRNLVSQGHRFATRCDTEVWVHLYEEMGAGVFEAARGQFAVALWDMGNCVGLLGRDRVGIAPLYYTVQDEWLLWGSEIKALLASGMVDVRPNVRGIDYFFNFFSMPPSETCFEGIQLLPPGHFIKTGDGHYELQQYWDLDFPDNGSELRFSDPKSGVDQLEGLLRNAVRRRLTAEVPQGCYLSSGIDSGILLALSAQERGESLPSFTIRFEGSAPIDESERAASTAEFVRSPLATVTVRETDIARMYPRLISASEGPVVDTSAACMVMLADANRRAGNKVTLSGEGADEALAGYVWFKWHQVQQWLDRYLVFVSGIGQNVALRWLIGGDTTRWPKLRAARGLRPAQQISWEMMAQARSFLYSDEMWDLLADYDPYNDLPISSPRLKRWHPLNQSLYVAYKVMLPGLLLLGKGDRPLKAASTEGRYPFLDESVVEFCAQIAPIYKLRGWTDKWLLRQVAARHLPKQIARRKKTMFRANLGRAFLNANRPPWIDQLISDASLRATGYFNPAGVRRAREAQQQLPRRSLLRFSLDLGLSAVVSTQLWHHLYCGGKLADLPTWSAPLATPTRALAT
jgi:asparagine synthase (glutamine-hydrolysing)